MEDQISKLKELGNLLEKGLISLEEFEDEKSLLLDEVTQELGTGSFGLKAEKVLPWVLGVAIVIGLFFVFSSNKEKEIPMEGGAGASEDAPVLPFIYGL